MPKEPKLRSNLDIDFGWLVQCRKRLDEMADDPQQAELIKQVMDKNPEIREELPHIYVKVLKTLGY